MFKFFLIVLATLILLAMFGYMVSLFMQLYQQKKRIKQAQQERHLNVIESIDVITRAMIATQCDFSEGVLRLKPLLNVVGKSLESYAAMWELYQLVETMPILDARKNLKRNERMKLDLVRQAKEAELDNQIKIELQRLLVDIGKYQQQLATD
ncbi:uncharacterized protein DUF2489 [Nicoletella semolina]|uniref:Uncharacterized protein DUF2489 n=1 Tax=Nicoletella semolina TaxID=271160 RepID=A0A4R2N4C7_9PAST|nr:DUF2489 domain-containing protein [Nicoletella semolina]MDH2925227.1 coproporphyrinogen III oxidase [Nicoletella semolina]TCP15309.1 uncharacterized protein DUF2489 [Nicoletella semolina]